MTKTKENYSRERCHLSQKLFLGTVALISSKTLRGKHQTLYSVSDDLPIRGIFSPLLGVWRPVETLLLVFDVQSEA